VADVLYWMLVDGSCVEMNAGAKAIFTINTLSENRNFFIYVNKRTFFNGHHRYRPTINPVLTPCHEYFRSDQLFK
jgi:hypothetical protein